MPDPITRQRIALNQASGDAPHLPAFCLPWPAWHSKLEPAVLRAELAEMMRLRDLAALSRLGGVAGIASAIARAIDNGTDGQALLLGDSCGYHDGDSDFLHADNVYSHLLQVT